MKRVNLLSEWLKGPWGKPPRKGGGVLGGIGIMSSVRYKKNVKRKKSHE